MPRKCCEWTVEKRGKAARVSGSLVPTLKVIVVHSLLLWQGCHDGGLVSVQASPEASHAWSVVAQAGAPTWTRLTDCGVEQASAALWMFSLEILTTP